MICNRANVVSKLVAGGALLIASVTSAFADTPMTSEQYFAKGTKESSEAQYAAAIADFDKAIQKDSKNWKAYGNRAAARFNVKNYAGAVQDIDICIAHMPPMKVLNDQKVQYQNALDESRGTVEAGNGSGNANADAENAEARRRMANQMLLNATLGGDFADPSTMIMMQAQRRGLIPGGPAVIPSVPVRTAPSSETSSFNGHSKGPFDGAASASHSGGGDSSPFAGAASPQTSGNPSPYADSTAAMASSQPPQSMSGMQSGGGSESGMSAQNYFDRGCDKTAVSNFVEAIKDYDEAIKRDPNFGKAYANRGSARYNMGNHKGALADFDMAVRLMPENAAVKALRDQIARSPN